MTHFKTAATITALLLSISIHAHANDVKTLQKQLKQWQPIEITEKNNIVTVALDENSITPQIYDAVVSAGICSDVWIKDVPNNYMKTTKELHILNKHKAKGYVLRKPLATCNEMGKENEERAKVIMLSNTHLY